MKHFIFTSFVLMSSSAFAADQLTLGVNFDNELYTKSNLSIGLPFEHGKSIGLSYGGQRFKDPRKESVEYANAKDYSLFYSSSAAVSKEGLVYRSGLAAGMMKYPAISDRSTHNYLQTNGGVGLRQGSVSLITDFNLRWNAVRGDEVVLVGSKSVELLSLFIRFGFEMSI